MYGIVMALTWQRLQLCLDFVQENIASQSFKGRSLTRNGALRLLGELCIGFSEAHSKQRAQGRQGGTWGLCLSWLVCVLSCHAYSCIIKGISYCGLGCQVTSYKFSVLRGHLILT